MSNIVWSTEKGWHDGPECKVFTVIRMRGGEESIALIAVADPSAVDSNGMVAAIDQSNNFPFKTTLSALQRSHDEAQRLHP